MIGAFSNSFEIQSALTNDPDKTTESLNTMLLSVIESWYRGTDKIVFDKSRGWSFNAMLLDGLFDNIKMIATVRDLRSTFGSIEKQHRKTPMFDKSDSPNGRTMFARADVMMAPDGLIGQCAIGLEDLMARANNNLYVLQYEAFTLDPKSKIREIYNFLELPHFEHDFDNVVNVSEDVDAIHLNKFPHEGSGKVTPTDRNEWSGLLPSDLGALIHQRYPRYNEMYGYQ